LGNDLWQLCARYGIATDYHDIWGTRHAVEPAHLKTLLREFDIDLDAGADSTPPWQPALTPVKLLHAGRAEFELSVWVPHGLADLVWHIEAEDGQSHTGTAHAEHLMPGRWREMQVDRGSTLSINARSASARRARTQSPTAGSSPSQRRAPAGTALESVPSSNRTQ